MCISKLSFLRFSNPSEIIHKSSHSMSNNQVPTKSEVTNTTTGLTVH